MQKVVGYYNDFAEKLAAKMNEEIKAGWKVVSVTAYDSKSVVVVYEKN